MRDSLHGSVKHVDLHSPAGSALASHSHAADIGNACSLRTDRPALTDSSVTACWFILSTAALRCVHFCKAYSCASVLAQCFVC